MQAHKLSYIPLHPQQTPKLHTKQTNQQRFWKKYQTSQLLTSTFLPSSITANKNQKNLMIFAHGRAITLLDTSTKQIVRKIQNYTYGITATTIRRDGLVMATGDQEGRVEVKDTKEKFNLRTFDQHKRKITCLDFFGQDLYSAGEDMIIRLFDVAAGEIVHSYQNAHTDYVKCVKGLQNNHLLSAGYDGLIKLFDFRVHEKPQIQFNHGNQVEWFDIFPSNINFTSCGDKKICLWDIRSTKPIVETFSSKKTISCIRVLPAGNRVMSSSYDNYIKVYKSDTFEVTYQEKMQAPVLCFDVSRNSQFIGIGLQNKKIVMKCRANTKDEDFEDQEEKEIEDEIAQWLKNNQTKGKFALDDKYFYRGIYDKPQNYDIQFERNQKKKTSEYDRLLKKFQYKKALFLSLQKKNMTIFLALVDQLQQRGSLDRILRSLTQPQLEQLIKTLSSLLHDIRYSEVAYLLLNKLTDFHADVGLDAWNSLRKNVESEIQAIEELSVVGGMLELIEKNCNQI